MADLHLHTWFGLLRLSLTVRMSVVVVTGVSHFNVDMLVLEEESLVNIVYGVWGLGFGVWGLGFGVWEIGRAHV